MGSGLGSLLTWTWIRPSNTKDGLFGTYWVTMTCGKPCQGKTVIFGGVFCTFGGLKRGHGVTAGNIFPFGHGLGPMMERMDCLANFGPLQADFNCVKHCKRKVVKSGGVSVLLGG